MTRACIPQRVLNIKLYPHIITYSKHFYYGSCTDPFVRVTAGLFVYKCRHKYKYIVGCLLLIGWNFNSTYCTMAALPVAGNRRPLEGLQAQLTYNLNEVFYISMLTASLAKWSACITQTPAARKLVLQFT